MSGQINSPTEEKNDTMQIESAPLPSAPYGVHTDEQLDAIKEGRDVQLKSEFDSLTVWQTVKVYRNALIVCGLAGFAAATDGEFFGCGNEPHSDGRISEHPILKCHCEQGFHRSIQARSLEET